MMFKKIFIRNFSRTDQPRGVQVFKFVDDLETRKEKGVKKHQSRSCRKKFKDADKGLVIKIFKLLFNKSAHISLSLSVTGSNPVKSIVLKHYADFFSS